MSECGSTWALGLMGTASIKAVLCNTTGGSFSLVMSSACGLGVSLAVFADEWHVDVVGAAAGCYYCWANVGF